jgi:hypothetical protein
MNLDGYTVVSVSGVDTYRHRIIAEAALGRPLPKGAEVHHVDEDKRNDAPGNLVICQDREYHNLLHVRARVLRAGGDPNTQRICYTCKQLVELTGIAKSARRRGTLCRPCVNTSSVASHRRRRARLAPKD